MVAQPEDATGGGKSRKIPVFVFCEDGKCYRDPLWFGESEGRQWFIRFEAYDPPELIVEGDVDLGTAAEVLGGLTVVYRLTTTWSGGTYCYPQDHFDLKVQRPSTKFSFHFVLPPPVPNTPNTASEEPSLLVQYDLVRYGGKQRR